MITTRMKIEHLKKLKAVAEKEMIDGKFEYDRKSAKEAFFWLNDQILIELKIEIEEINRKDIDLAAALRAKLMAYTS